MLLWMELNKPKMEKPPYLIADWETSESCAEKEQRNLPPCVVMADQSTNGNCSQTSMSRSSQRAEIMFRSTFNPSFKCLFHVPNEDEEEENLVVAHNLVSRSSARLQRVQQHLSAGAGRLMGSLPGQYRASWRLFEQRSSSLFIHEYTRRVRSSAAFISRMNHSLQHQLQEINTKVPPSSHTSRIGSVSLSQEFRLHSNHWTFLYSRAHSDHYSRQASLSHTKMSEEMKQTLHLLGLQLLVSMEQYVYGISSVIGKTESDSIPRDVLEDVVAGTDSYNQAVEEYNIQLNASQLRMLVLQEAHKSKFFASLPKITRLNSSAVSVKGSISVSAVHRAEMVARQSDLWISEESSHVCKSHSSHKACSDNFVSHTSECSYSWERLWHTYSSSSPLSFEKPFPNYSPSHHSHSCALENHLPILIKSFTFQYKEGRSIKNECSQCQTCGTQSGVTQLNAKEAQSNLDRNWDCLSPPVATSHHVSASLPHQSDQSSVEPSFQVLVSSTDSSSPLAFQRPTAKEPRDQSVPFQDVAGWNPGSNGLDTAAHSSTFSKQSGNVTNNQKVEGTDQDWTESKITAGNSTKSSGASKGEDFRNEGKEETRAANGEPDSVCRPHSVQWMDMGRLVLLSNSSELYQSQSVMFCTHASWLKLHTATVKNSAGSINVQDDHRSFQISHTVTYALETGSFPKEFRTILENVRQYLSVQSAHAHWDSVMCRGSGSTLKDKCVRNESSSFAGAGAPEEGSIMMSQTMVHFLQLLPPSSSSSHCCQSNSSFSDSVGLSSPSCESQSRSVGLSLASVQISTIWIMFKAYQFLSSWSPNKFSLITQGDLSILMESSDKTFHQTKSILSNFDTSHHPTSWNHYQFLSRHQLEALDRAACESQAFSSSVSNNFSMDCKRMSGEIFERTMPSAVHWRPSQRTGFPSSPSEYASSAAQAVIGQVLEAVAPFSEDARVQASSVTMTAFMEAWMEHILKQKIKFSVQGASQLKQDFDSIREMIKSDKYGSSAELHQRSSSLSVFQQVDSASLCLSQQPQAKPYSQRSAWEPFTRCCPVKSSRDSLDAAVGGNITNSGCVEGEESTQCDPSALASVLPPGDMSTPAEPYLAASPALGAAQQEWLDSRIHSSSRRWRSPGLQCSSKTEP